MDDEVLPKEILDIYRRNKAKVLKASEYIVAHLNNLKDDDKRDESLRILHREIGNILHYLDFIKSYGTKEEQEKIEKFQDAGARYNSFVDVDLYLKYQAEIAYWASKANTIGLNLKEKKSKLLPIHIDFTLFRVLSPEFKLI